MGFEQVFDNLIFKRNDCFEEKVQSFVDYSLNYCFLGICTLKQIVTMIVRVRLF